jgi:hypothetical protein
LADISIENVVNDTLITAPTNELDIEVNYGNTTFFNFFKKLSGVEILLNSKVVAERSSFLGLPKIFGKDTFKVNTTGLPDGQYKLQAKGYIGFRIFGRSVVSEEILMTIDRSQCDPKESFIVFTGHNDVTSMMEGRANITWSPGFVVVTEGLSLIWCEEFTYDVFVAEGEFDVSVANVTGPELIELADSDGKINRYETTNLTLVVTDLQPGANYTFFVMAKSNTGHYSDSRNGATIEISTSDIIVRSDFTRLVNIPEPTELFQVINNIETFVVRFRVSFQRR